MIYLGELKKIRDNVYRVDFVHSNPDLVKDKSNGIEVEELPEEEVQEGKIAVLYVNKDTKEPFYEYEDMPISKETKIEILEKQVAELSFLVMQLQGGAN